MSGPGYQDSARNAARSSSGPPRAISRSISAWARVHSGNALAEQRAAGRGDCQTTAAFIFLVDRNLHQSAAFKWFEGRGERGAVHGKQRRDATDVRRFRPVQRHQQRELPMREIERTEHLVETPCQRARRPLHVQAQAGVAHLVCRGKR